MALCGLFRVIWLAVGFDDSLQACGRSDREFIGPRKAMVKITSLDPKMVIKTGGIRGSSYQVNGLEVIVQEFGPAVASVWAAGDGRHSDREWNIGRYHCGRRFFLFVDNLVKITGEGLRAGWFRKRRNLY